MDIDAILPGVDFRDYITDALKQAVVVLIIIGPKWRGTRTRGQYRIQDETDPVRLEAETALRLGIPVIPVLVEGALMPKPTDLPESLRKLPYINAASIDSGRDFRTHLDFLIRFLEGIVANPTARNIDGGPSPPVPQVPDGVTTATGAEARRREVDTAAAAERQRSEELAEAAERQRAAEAAAAAERHRAAEVAEAERQRAAEAAEVEKLRAGETVEAADEQRVAARAAERRRATEAARIAELQREAETAARQRARKAARAAERQRTSEATYGSAEVPRIEENTPTGLEVIASGADAHSQNTSRRFNLLLVALVASSVGELSLLLVTLLGERLMNYERDVTITGSVFAYVIIGRDILFSLGLGYVAMVVLGFAVHFSIALFITFGFAFFARGKQRVLERPLPSGIALGSGCALVWLALYFARTPGQPHDPSLVALDLIRYIVFGVTASFITSRMIRARDPGFIATDVSVGGRHVA